MKKIDGKDYIDAGFGVDATAVRLVVDHRQVVTGRYPRKVYVVTHDDQVFAVRANHADEVMTWAAERGLIGPGPSWMN